MKRLALIIGCLFGASVSHALYSGYTYQRILTIDHTKVSTMSATYANFPVLVSINGVTLSTSAGSGHLADPNGYDLIYSTNSDCSYKIFWDTETVNTTGSATRNEWVEVPSISSNTDTLIYLCYGNSAITSYQGVSTNTWDSNFKGVWHFRDGVTLGLTDSTNVGNTWSNTNSVAAATGNIDGGLVTNGTNNNLSLPANTTSLQITNNLTMSNWWKSTTGTQRNSVFDNQLQGASSVGVGYGVTGGKLGVQNEADSTLTGATTITDGNWHYLTFTYASGLGTVYVDGVSDGSVSYGFSTIAYGTTQPEYIGRNFAGSFDAFTADEYRISNTLRSPGWIQTEYKTVNSSTTFITFGAETQTVSSSVPNNRGLAIQGGKFTILGGKLTIL